MWPRCLRIPAKEAIAVPQIPMRWTCRAVGDGVEVRGKGSAWD